MPPRPGRPDARAPGRARGGWWSGAAPGPGEGRSGSARRGCWRAAGSSRSCSRGSRPRSTPGGPQRRRAVRAVRPRAARSAARRSRRPGARRGRGRAAPRTSVLARSGLVPDAYAGHSLGEWTGMIAAERILIDDDVDELLAGCRSGRSRCPTSLFAAAGCGADGRGRASTGSTASRCPTTTARTRCIAVRSHRSHRASRGERLLAERRAVPGPAVPLGVPLAAVRRLPRAARARTSRRSRCRRPHTPLWSATTTRPRTRPSRRRRPRAGPRAPGRRRCGSASWSRRCTPPGCGSFVQLGVGAWPASSTTRSGRAPPPGDRRRRRAAQRRRAGARTCCWRCSSRGAASTPVAAAPDARARVPVQLGVPLIEHACRRRDPLAAAGAPTAGRPVIPLDARAGRGRSRALTRGRAKAVLDRAGPGPTPRRGPTTRGSRSTAEPALADHCVLSPAPAGPSWRLAARSCR